MPRSKTIAKRIRRTYVDESVLLDRLQAAEKGLASVLRAVRKQNVFRCHELTTSCLKVMSTTKRIADIVE